MSYAPQSHTPQPHRSQQWEYTVIQETIFPLRPLRITVESEDEALTNVLQGKSVVETLNYMGSNGWELVHVSPGFEKNTQVFYFKRPKPIA